MNTNYAAKTIRIGVITVLCACIANFAPVLYLALFKGISPTIGDIFQIWGLLAATYMISWIVQPISCFPIMGTSGSYMGWVAGSVTDVRMPAVSMALKSAGIEQGTREGNAIATLATAVSIFTTFIILSVFTVIGNQVLALLPQSVLDAFTYVVPSIFSAVYMSMALKNLKLGVPVLLLIFAATYILPSLGFPRGLMTLCGVVVGMIWAKVIYEMDKKKSSQANT